MNGSAIPLAQFLSNTSARFFVPVYQRAYSWTERQCQQLFDDLEGVLRENRATHFFGSIVLQGETRGAYTDYQVIDGQQRITTLLLLLLALHDLLTNDLSASAENRQLGKAIMGRYLIDLFAVHQEERLRLHLCGADAQTWKSLLGLDGTPVGDSPLKRNRLFFEECLRHASYPPERIYDAIQKLVVICITLGADDDPQLIFESLNATGLALTEGDKVRNFLLMSLPPAEQERLHARHWTAIERHTRGAVSELIRDFLSIKRQRTPRLDAVYATFKQFSAESGLGREAMLQALECYAKWFGQLRDCGARDWFPALRASLYRLNRLDVAVLRPFALEVLRRHEEGALTQEELLAIFTTVEAYLLRRAICEVPTNALNKIFLTLDGDIARLTHGGARYVDVFAYILLSKQGGGRFPDDKEFRAALAARQVYKMGRDYRHYLFERLENGGYKETKDVYAHLDRGEYSIEHILPQHLSQTWRDALGPRCEEIHATWLHRLANLTLTGYNANLSNASFIEKRDYPDGGFRDSNLHLNKALGQLDRWDEATLQARETELCDRALALWPLPKTDFRPLERQCDTFTLADETTSLINRKPARYQFHGDPLPVKDWTEIFVGVTRNLLGKHRAALHALAATNGGGFAWLARTPDGLRAPEKLGDGLFLEKHGNTDQRLRNLRNLFIRLGEDPEALVFYLRNTPRVKDKPNTTEQHCRAYWSFALPTLKAQCPWLAKRNPTINSHLMTHRPGIHGYELHYVATASAARVLLAIWLGSPQANKAAFDRLFAHRAAIEAAFGAPLRWERYDKGHSAWLEYRQPDLDVRERKDWPRILAFHEQWGKRLWEAVWPFIPHA